jgi:hypothetical protein
MSDFYVDQVVEYRPRITGGVVIAVVTAVRDIPLFGVTLDIRVTDGTGVWPTGLRTSVFAEDVS